jgi:two-component sensor histidine kinase
MRVSWHRIRRDRRAEHLRHLAAGFFVVALAEIFRRAMRRALADREMLLLELEHRVKNNFASIASVLPALSG